jgi:TonB-dependent starch-binding outer membrane protein SusC
MINPLKYNSILFSIFFLFISVFSFSQNFLLTGSILDQHKEPVKSAIIERKGTNLATISNSKGDFTINLSSVDSVLIISKKGYFEKEINVFGKENIEIELVRIEKTYINAEDFNTVAGYGQWKDVNTSNSVSHILLGKYHKSSKSLLDILELMPGITIRSESGQPGANANITFRGVESVISNQPLIIIDGIVLNSGINMPDISPETSVLSAINVADVKRIEVIKDAGSTAIFGSLGANGVIIIETEKGAKNSYKLKNHTQFGVNFPIEANNMLDPYGYFNLVNESLYASSMNPIHFPDYTTAKNWEKDILHPGIIAKNTLSLEGGGEKSQFYLSGNINHNMGVLKNSSLTSGGIRANYSTSVARWLDIAFHGVYSESYQKSPVQIENRINSNPYMYSRFYPPISKDEIKAIPELSVPFGQTDPMELVNKTDPYNSTSFFIGGVDLAFNITDHLSFHSKINGDYSYFKKGSSVFSPEYSYLDELHQTQKSELTNWEFNNFLKFQQLKGNNNLLIILGLSELNLKVKNSINSVFIDGNTLSENWVENVEGDNTRKLSTIYTKLQYAYKDYFDISASFSREKILNKDGVDLFGIFPSVSTGVWFKKSNVNEDEIFSAMKFFFGMGYSGSKSFLHY